MIPTWIEDLAWCAQTRYDLPDEEKYLFDYWFQEKYGYEYGQQPKPILMLNQAQINNTIIFLSRVPSNGVQEAGALIELVQFYEGLKDQNVPQIGNVPEPAATKEEVLPANKEEVLPAKEDNDDEDGD